MFSMMMKLSQEHTNFSVFFLFSYTRFEHIKSTRNYLHNQKKEKEHIKKKRIEVMEKFTKQNTYTLKV